MPINAEALLRILACPVCLGDLTLLEHNEETGFACETCRVVYPVKDDIPVMLQKDAIPRDTWDNAGTCAKS